MILFNTCSVREHAEDKIYSALGRLRSFKTRAPRQDHRRDGLHGPEGSGAGLRAGPVRRSGRRPRPAAQIPGLARARLPRGKGPADGGQPRPQGRHRDEIKRSHESFDPLRDPGDAADAVPGVRADSDRLRQVLHLLHRADDPRPRAKPAAAADSRRSHACSPSKAAKRSRCSARRSTATSYQRAAARRRGCRDLLHSLHEIDGIERLKFVTNYPKDMTDDLLQAVRDLPKCSPVSARAGAERFATTC